MKNSTKIIILIGLIAAINLMSSKSEVSTSKSFQHIIYQSVKAGGAS